MDDTVPLPGGGIRDRLKASKRARARAKGLYLPPIQANYDFSLLSQRLLFVREQHYRQTCLTMSWLTGIAERTLAAYEQGDFEPRYAFFVKATTNLYGPFILHILIGDSLLTLPPLPVEPPAFSLFSQRLAHLRESILGLSRLQMSALLDNFSPFNLKNYERGEREPNIAFLRLAVSHEALKPYFYWLLFGLYEPIHQYPLFPD